VNSSLFVYADPTRQVMNQATNQKVFSSQNWKSCLDCTRR